MTLSGYDQAKLDEALRIVRDTFGRNERDPDRQRAMDDLISQINWLRHDLLWERDSTEKLVDSRDRAQAEVERLQRRVTALQDEMLMAHEAAAPAALEHQRIEIALADAEYRLTRKEEENAAMREIVQAVSNASFYSDPDTVTKLVTKARALLPAEE